MAIAFEKEEQTTRKVLEQLNRRSKPLERHRQSNWLTACASLSKNTSPVRAPAALGEAPGQTSPGAGAGAAEAATAAGSISVKPAQGSTFSPPQASSHQAAVHLEVQELAASSTELQAAPHPHVGEDYATKGGLLELLLQGSTRIGVWSSGALVAPLP